MKKVAAMVVLLGVVVFSSVALAGNGGGLNARLAKLDAKVAKYHTKCDGANAPAKCAAVKDRLSARMTKLEGKLDARIAKVTNADRKAKLQSVRDHIAGLLASL